MLVKMKMLKHGNSIYFTLNDMVYFQNPVILLDKYILQDLIILMVITIIIKMQL